MIAATTSWGTAILVMAFVSTWAGCSNDSPPGAAALPEPNLPILIEPTAGVGRIRAGMDVEQVVAALGPAQRRTANALEYTRLGLAIMPGEGLVQFVLCGDVNGIHGSFVEAFKGRTKEGIGMRSTRAEVIRAFGEPTRSDKLAFGLESLRYEPLGLVFTLEGGKVHHIVVGLKTATTAPEPEATVNLVPAP